MERRAFLLAGAAGLGALAARPAEACSITADRNTPFDDRACRRALRGFVDLLNRGPQMSLEAIAREADGLSVTVDQEMIYETVAEADATETDKIYYFYKEFRLSDGKPDPRPMRVSEESLIRRLRNRATYQFTLERYSYHEADPDGCNGMFTHDEFFGVDRTSYLATFHNNRLTSVKPFPEWYLEAKG